MGRPRLLIATTSAGKLREWQGLLSDLPVELVRLSDVGIDFDVDETGSTFRENAVLKADAYGHASGLLTLAEDSGLCVAALGGGPGVHSARWEGQDYSHKNALLIRLLANFFAGHLVLHPRADCHTLLVVRLRRGATACR